MSKSNVARKTDDAEAGLSETTSGNVQQFVIFHVKDEMFAVPLAEVQEIIRLPNMVRLPLSPPALEGLANLRGTVLPIVNLRSVFGFDPVDPNDATRVVVLDQGCPVGLVVDRMANVVSVEASAIEAAGTIQSTVDTNLLTGMIKNSDGKSMVMILDAGGLIKREFHDIGATISDKALTTVGMGALSANDDKKSANDVLEEIQLVSFDVSGQEYAFPIEDVQEIVQLPERITEIPNAPAHVLGIITLRNRLLPLVSLREMFGLPKMEMTEANKVVVVSLQKDGGMSVGVVMDRIKEVLRVNSSAIDTMPALLSRGGSLNDIPSICRLDEGRRLVSILSAGRMFNADELAKLVDGKTPEMEEDMAEKSETASAGVSDDEEQFVVFRLVNEEYGVPIGSVQEIVRVPEDLTRVPKTPDFIEGMINLRGSVLAVVDQRKRFGLPGIERNDRQRIMVFTIKGIRTGFIVDSVSEVMRISARFIGEAPKLSSEQQKLIRRVANLEAKKRMILLLDIDQLLNVDELGALQKDDSIETAREPAPSKRKKAAP